MNAQQYVATKVFVQRIDTRGETWWEVVDGFDSQRVSEPFTDEKTADAACAEARARRVVTVQGGV